MGQYPIRAHQCWLSLHVLIVGSLHILGALAFSSKSALLVIALVTSMSLRAFLLTVDQSRDSRFVDVVRGLLEANEITEAAHLKNAKEEDWVFEHVPTAGKIQFMREAVEKYNREAKRTLAAQETPSLDVEAGVEPRSEVAALLKMLGKDMTKHEHVDIGKKLDAVHLGEHLPSSVWPEMTAVQELNTRIKRTLKTGQEAVFMAVDLRK